MKQFFLLSLVLFIVGSTQAQDDALPTKVQAAFDAKYPGVVDPYWGMDNDNYVIEFEFGGNDVVALFSSNGAWVETKQFVEQSAIPTAVMTAASKKYPVGEFYDLYKVLLPGDKTAYDMRTDVETTSYAIRVDATGKIISTVASEIEGY